MPALFLAAQAVRTARIVKTPAFAALSQATQKGIMKNLAKETAKGYAKRKVIYMGVGIAIDPYNRFLVPLSGGALISSQEAAENVINLEVTPREPVKAIQTILALKMDPLSFGVEAIGETFRNIRGSLRAKPSDFKLPTSRDEIAMHLVEYKPMGTLL